MIGMEESFGGACCREEEEGVYGGGGAYHLSKDFLRESLSELVDIYFTAGAFDTFLFGVGERLNVPIHGPVDNSNARSHIEGCSGYFDG